MHNRHYEKFADGTVKDIEDEIPFEVPEGWEWTKIRCVSSEILYGVSESAKESGKYRLLRITDIQDDKVDWESVPFTDFPEDKVANYILKNGDIVFARTGATVGKSYLIEKLSVESIYASYLIRIRTSQQLNPKYIKYFFGSLCYWNQITDKSSGIGQPNVNGTSLANLYIPIPPYDEQGRILPAIEKSFALIDSLETDKSDLQTAIRQAKSKILNLAIHGKLVSQDSSDEPASVLLEKLRAEKEAKIAKGELKRDKNDSYIYKSTTDNCHYEKFADGTEEQVELPYDLPESWSWIKIKDVISYIGDGDWIESKDQSDNGIRLIQTGNIGFGNFRDKEGKYHYITEETFDKLCCNEIFPGDILISRLPEPVGRACIIPNLSQRLITAVDCTIIRLNEKIIIREYFVYYTQSSKYLGFIKDNCTGTTRLRISRANLEKIYIPLPSLSEQQRILNKIESLFTKLDEIALNLS